MVKVEMLMSMAIQVQVDQVKRMVEVVEVHIELLVEDLLVVRVLMVP